jgi:predicted amidophosphoribosyltransferase
VIQCPRCHAANREGARFCRECGTRLEAACSACGAKVELGSKFCDSCGVSLVTDAAPASAPPRFASPKSYIPKPMRSVFSPRSLPPRCPRKTI